MFEKDNFKLIIFFNTINHTETYEYIVSFYLYLAEVIRTLALNNL